MITQMLNDASQMEILSACSIAIWL